MTGRERLLTALDGHEPDRVARAMGFSRSRMRLRRRFARRRRTTPARVDLPPLCAYNTSSQQ